MEGVLVVLAGGFGSEARFSVLLWGMHVILLVESSGEHDACGYVCVGGAVFFVCSRGSALLIIDCRFGNRSNRTEP